MQCCKRCNLNKPLLDFHADSRYKIRFSSWCRDCHREYNSLWFKKNKERLKKKSAIWRENNLEKARIINRNFKARNKERLAKEHSEWAKNNKGLRIATMAKRKAAKLQATPSWSDLNIIKSIYKQAATWQIITGQRLHVDHIIPLQGENVSGLHCPQNLQIIEGRLNESKGNKYIEDAYRQPDMFIEQPKKKPEQGNLTAL